MVTRFETITVHASGAPDPETGAILQTVAQRGEYLPAPERFPERAGAFQLSRRPDLKTLSRVAGAALLLAAVQAFAAQPIYKTDGLALSGYDAVAYFIEGKAVKGSKELETEWSGARWRFASASNRDAFVAAPARYAPQYGGYCAWAVSKDYIYSADPEAWRIVAGKLYLNYNKDVQHEWQQELPRIIDRADKNWPAVLDKPAK